MFFQSFVIVLFCAIAVQGKTLVVKNVGSKSLVVSVSDQDDITVLSGEAALVTVSDDFSGTLSAVPVDAEVTSVRTKAEFTLSDTSDTFAVSLIDGFNLEVKIVAVGASCSASLCMANLLDVCPTSNQVTNSAGTVVACTNNETIFGTICPKALVTSTDVAVNCTGALSYLVLMG
ncbi:hypothetical protein JTB14_017046 [Gonioctena quinquepunctata]|nr:hypothetical protein JTB14_017046 [Gonioctena quinquepunctata]